MLLESIRDALGFVLSGVESVGEFILRDVVVLVVAVSV